jgi:hypothetical protein
MNQYLKNSEDTDKVELVRQKIIDDFISISKNTHDPNLFQADGFASPIDLMPLLSMIFTPVAEKIVEIISEKITKRGRDAYLTEKEIKEIKELVLNYDEYQGSLPSEKIISSETRKTMADSVERVLRNNPRTLLK